MNPYSLPLLGRLLVAKRNDRILPGGHDGWIDAEDESGHGSYKERGDDRPARDLGFKADIGFDDVLDGWLTHQPWKKFSDRDGQADAEQDAQETTDSGQGPGFDKELGNDVFPRGTESAPDADLPRPLDDGGEHDVHDSDTTHQQADGSDACQEQVHRERGSLDVFEQFPGHDQGDIIVFGVSDSDDLLNLLCNLDDLVR